MKNYYRGATGFKKVKDKESHIGRWQRWLSRHEKILSLIGLIIVFLTFCVKEIAIERVKDESASVTTAKEDFLYNNESEQVMQVVNDLRYEVLQRATAFEDIPNLMMFNDLASSHRKQCDELMALIQKIPDNVKSIAEQREINDCKTVENDLLRTLEVEIKYMSTRNVHETAPDDHGAGIASFKAAQLEQKVFPDIKKLTTEVIEMLDRINEKEEARIRRFTLLGNLLYGIGWGLAFVAKTFGIDVELGGD